MVSLEMPKNFQFYLIFPIHNLTQGSTTMHHLHNLHHLFPWTLDLSVFNPNSTFRIELKMAKKDEQRKKCKLHERSKKFQDTWKAKLPWVEFVFDEKGGV